MRHAPYARRLLGPGAAIVLLAAPLAAAPDSGARIEYARGRSIGVQVVLDNGRPMPFRAEGPNRWVFRGDPEDLVNHRYRIVLDNPNDERLKVVVAIDGINVYFKKPLVGDATEDLGAILSARSDRTIKGWQVTDSEAQELVFSPSRWSEGEGVTDREIGRIEVHVYREAREVRDEAVGRAAPGTSRARPEVGTAAGEVIDNGVRPVRFVSATREPVAQALLSYGRSGRGGAADRGGRLGVTGQDGEYGVLVTGVQPNSLAEEAGLRQGDTIVRADGNLYPEMEELRHILRQKGRGETLVLELRRGRHEVTMRIRL